MTATELQHEAATWARETRELRKYPDMRHSTIIAAQQEAARLSAAARAEYNEERAARAILAILIEMNEFAFADNGRPA